MQFEWRITDPPVEFGDAVSRSLIEIISKQLPDLLDMFPMQYGWDLNAHLDEGWFAVKVIDCRGSTMPSVGKLSDTELSDLREKLLPFQPRGHKELAALLGSSWFDFKTFTYVGPRADSKACWPDVHSHLIDWLNAFVLPEVEKWNRQRVLRAIPESPQFNIEMIRQHLWVLECEESNQQGTAFSLEGVGLVTCEHVLGPATHAFRASDINMKFPVRVSTANKDIDIAVIEIEPPISGGLRLGTADNLREMDHLAVTGFPNYHLGDSGVISPGLIIGFRMRSGMRRILTNAPIVAGASGGPVLDKYNCVVGIAVTGSDSFKTAQETEKHGIIPIDALKFLKIGT